MSRLTIRIAAILFGLALCTATLPEASAGPKGGGGGGGGGFRGGGGGGGAPAFRGGGGGAPVFRGGGGGGMRAIGPQARPAFRGAAPRFSGAPRSSARHVGSSARRAQGLQRTATTQQAAMRGRFAAANPRLAARVGAANPRIANLQRTTALAPQHAWRRGWPAVFVPWLGGVFWPYAYWDIFYFAFWPLLLSPLLLSS